MTKSELVELCTLFGQTADAVWVSDAAQHLVFLNQAAQSMLACQPGEAKGKHCFEQIKGHDPQGERICKPRCVVSQQARIGQPVAAFSLQVRGRDRRSIWGSVSIVAIPDDDPAKGYAGLAHIFRPIKEGKAWIPPLRIHLLGTIVVQRPDGTLVDGPLWRRAKVRAMLAFLALRRGQPVHRDILIDRLWPDRDHDSALHNLNTTVYNLRKSLEPDQSRGEKSTYLRYEGDCYLLDGARAHWLDIAEFESSIAQARCAEDPGRAVLLYRKALALYRGEYVADLDPDLLNCSLERERLSQLYLSAMEELALHHARQGEYKQACDLYLQALSIDPYRETAAQNLMRLAIRRGNRAEAIAHYRRLERALWQDLEVLPSPESCLLYETAMHGGWQGVSPRP